MPTPFPVPTPPPPTPPPPKRSAAWVFFGLCAVVALVLMLDQVTFIADLPRARVEASREQLRDLARRLRVERLGGRAARGAAAAAGAPAVAQIVLTFSSPCGGFLGSVTAADSGADGGAGSRGRRAPFLFTLDGFRPGPSAEPRRAEVPVLLLARLEAGGPLVRSGARSGIAVGIEARADAEGDAREVGRQASRRSQSGARIDNRRGGRAAAEFVGRDLAALAAPPHCGFRPEDLRFFAQLARRLSVRVCEDLRSGAGCEVPTVLAWREPEMGRVGVEVMAASGVLDGWFDLRFRPGGLAPEAGHLAVRGAAASIRRAVELAIKPLAASDATGVSPAPVVLARHDPVARRNQWIAVPFESLWQAPAPASARGPAR